MTDPKRCTVCGAVSGLVIQGIASYGFTPVGRIYALPKFGDSFNYSEQPYPRVIHNAPISEKYASCRDYSKAARVKPALHGVIIEPGSRYYMGGEVCSPSEPRGKIKTLLRRALEFGCTIQVTAGPSNGEDDSAMFRAAIDLNTAIQALCPTPEEGG